MTRRSNSCWYDRQGNPWRIGIGYQVPVYEFPAGSIILQRSYHRPLCLPWYPLPYSALSGSTGLFVLVVGVDVVIGSVITVSIFDAPALNEEYAASRLVQIPCIERNAIAAVKAINAARMALRGGLAVNIVEC